LRNVSIFSMVFEISPDTLYFKKCINNSCTSNEFVQDLPVLNVLLKHQQPLIPFGIDQFLDPAIWHQWRHTHHQGHGQHHCQQSPENERMYWPSVRRIYVKQYNEYSFISYLNVSSNIAALMMHPTMTNVFNIMYICRRNQIMNFPCCFLLMQRHRL
jgi:hypothetical protein